MSLMEREEFGIEKIIRELQAAVDLGDAPKRGPFGVFVRKEYLAEAIALLRTHPAAQPSATEEPYGCGVPLAGNSQPNEPLTLEELEKMYGQPVWVESPNVDRKHSGRWGIVDCVIVPDKALFLKGDYPCHDYGTVWLAYRRPPKEA